MDTDNDNVYARVQDDDKLLVSQCIYCSHRSFSKTSRGSTSPQVSSSESITCQSCASIYCKSCIQEIIQSVDAFQNIPTTVKTSDPSFLQLLEIQRQLILGKRTTPCGPCCSFLPSQFPSSLEKTPRPDPASQCSRITAIRSYRSSITKKVNFQCLNTFYDDLNLDLYFRDPIYTSSGGGFKPKRAPQHLHSILSKKKRRRDISSSPPTPTYNPFTGALVFPTFGLLIGFVTITPLQDPWLMILWGFHTVYSATSVLRICIHQTFVCHASWGTARSSSCQLLHLRMIISNVRSLFRLFLLTRNSVRLRL